MGLREGDCEFIVGIGTNDERGHGMSDEVESILATILLRNPHEGFHHFQIRTNDWTKTTWYAGLF